MERQRVGSGYGYEAVHGYCRAVRVGAQVFVAGTTARGEALQGDAYAQAVSAIAVIGAALAKLGAGLGDVVRTVVYVVNIGDAESVSRAHREAFGAAPPASTMVQVAALLEAGMRVEIEATAMVT